MINAIKHRVNHAERGFTLAEVLVGIAIIGIIAVPLGIATYQVIVNNERSNNHMMAVGEVQNTGFWVSRDVQMAEGAVDTTDDVATAGVTEVITLDWTKYLSWVSGEDPVTAAQRTIYSLDSNELTRSVYVWDADNSEWDLQTSNTIAENIQSISFTVFIETITMTISAEVGEFQPMSEERTYEIIKRPNQ